MLEQIWIEPVGNIIIARLRGTATKELISEIHERILNIARDVGHGRVLIDALEMDPPPVEIPIHQWKLEEQSQKLNLRRAVVVPNTRLAYLARLAFGENVRIFYNDMSAAISWLTENSSA